MKLKRASEVLWIYGLFFVALGVAICSKSNLGVSMIAAPAFIVNEAIVPIWSGSTVGVIDYSIQGLLLILLCIVIRRFNWRYLLSFLAAVIYGYMLNFFLWLMGGISFDPVWLRWLMLLVGDVIVAFGVACFFRTYLPLEVYELVVTEVTRRFNLNINKFKWIYDISLLVISFLLAVLLFKDVGTFDWTTIGYNSYHHIGLGTIVTTIINAPIIAFMGKFIDTWFEYKPQFPKLARLARRNKPD